MNTASPGYTAYIHDMAQEATQRIALLRQEAAEGCQAAHIQLLCLQVELEAALAEATMAAKTPKTSQP